MDWVLGFVLCLFIINVFLSQICDSSSVESQGKLVFVHVLYRHGDRNIIEPYPNDPWKEKSYWPEGFSQLTKIGKQQHYELGQYLRQRYNHLLNTTAYSKELIYVQSTDVDRTLMSALSNLAGLFPPDSNQLWNTDIPWQPIPVHTTPETQDYVLAAKKSCPNYDYALKKYKNSPEYKELNKKFKPLYEYLTQHSGKKIDTFTGVNNLYNTLWIENLKNFTLPEWTKKVFPGGDMAWVSARSFATNTNTPELARLKTGFLLKEILQRFRNKTLHQLQPDRAMWVYSAHDTTVANLLNTLGLFELHGPPYRACIMLELHKHAHDYSVQVFYKNTTGDPLPMNIPRCGTSCPLDKMYELYAEVLPGDFDHECRLSMMSMTYEDADFDGSGMGIAIIALFLTLILVLILVSIKIYNNYNDSRWYLRIDN